MTTTAGIGSLEGRMCGHVAAALCRFVITRNGREAGEKGGSVANLDMSDWQSAQGALVEIGLMELRPIPDSTRKKFVLSIDADEMPAHLAASIGENDPRTPILLRAFISIACFYADYGDATLSSEREWFKPPKRYAAAMEWLSRTGYAVRSERQFRWAEKIAPIMRDCDCWTDENLSIETIAHAEEREEARLAWASMPELLRRAVEADRMSLLTLTKALALGWRDGRWHDFKWDDPFALTGQIPLAKSIIEIAEDA